MRLERVAQALTVRLALVVALCAASGIRAEEPAPGERIVLIGSGLAHRMQYFPHFETQLHRQFPNAGVVMRNLGRPGDTPGFRPHASRETPWAFPGAERFHPDKLHRGRGQFPTPDEWLWELQADTIFAFFGFNESIEGEQGLANFRAELAALVEHTLSRSYNGESPPRLILVSPIPFEDLSDVQALPDGVRENERLSAYADTIAAVASDMNVEFADVFSPMLSRYELAEAPLTINGFSLTDDGYREFATILRTAVYGEDPSAASSGERPLYDAVRDKNWHWRNDYGMLNDVHVYGRRVEPFGVENYPQEILKVRQMTALRDARVHELARGADAAPVDDAAQTLVLSEIETNFNLPIEFLDVERAIDLFELPDGFEIDLFASESEFPELRNPVQMSFDNRGRLWVAVAPSYPHWRPGDDKPDDKLLIFEDADRDGRADSVSVFADGLHLPFGFELAPEGVYLAQQPNLVLLADDDGDGRADRREILLHGFDSHDSHHAISAFAADASGAIYMSEGVFLHSQVETPYGPQRGVDGGVWRFDPGTWRLERFIQTSFANPWGFVFDEWDQPFVADASPGDNWWGLPLSAKTLHGGKTTRYAQFTTQRVRPTAGSEFISSRHFPDRFQGDYLVNNTIGFLGTKQHEVVDDGAGYTGEPRQDLVVSSDSNFRPVAIETAPDGSLYLIDWHNPLIGHMQHSARDPNRDHDHGRIYRVTYPGRDLVTPATVAGAPVGVLLDNLTLPEYRSRYRSRRELRGRPAEQVLPAMREWVGGLSMDDPEYERLVLEGLWVSWAQGRVDIELLERLLNARNFRARAAAARVLRYTWRQVPDHLDLMRQAARDPHPRVRLEAVVASSWLDNADGARVALEGLKQPVTRWMGRAYEDVLRVLDDDIRALHAAGQVDLADNPAAASYLAGNLVLYEGEVSRTPNAINLRAEDRAVYSRGEEIYNREGHCASCHGEDGAGAMQGIYPPLGITAWVVGDVERLIKLTLKGVYGPMQVGDRTYDSSSGVPPMVGFEGLLSDEEMADVLTYVRMRFGRVGAGSSSGLDAMVSVETVRQVREAARSQTGLYEVEVLLEEHPLEEL